MTNYTTLDMTTARTYDTLQALRRLESAPIRESEAPPLYRTLQREGYVAEAKQRGFIFSHTVLALSEEGKKRLAEERMSLEKITAAYLGGGSADSVALAQGMAPEDYRIRTDILAGSYDRNESSYFTKERERARRREEFLAQEEARKNTKRTRSSTRSDTRQNDTRRDESSGFMSHDPGMLYISDPTPHTPASNPFGGGGGFSGGGSSGSFDSSPSDSGGSSSSCGGGSSSCGGSSGCGGGGCGGGGD